MKKSKIEIIQNEFYQKESNSLHVNGYQSCKIFQHKINIIYAKWTYPFLVGMLLLEIRYKGYQFNLLRSAVRNLEKGSDTSQWWSICLQACESLQSHTLSKNERRKQRINIKENNSTEKMPLLRYCSGCSTLLRTLSVAVHLRAQNAARAQLGFSGSKSWKPHSSCKLGPGLQRKSLRNLRCSSCGRLLGP